MRQDTDIDDGEGSAHVHFATVAGVTVAQLALIVVAPALRIIVVEHCANVVVTRNHSDRVAGVTATTEIHCCQIVAHLVWISPNRGS